jgi:hypothetical protein
MCPADVVKLSGLPALRTELVRVFSENVLFSGVYVLREYDELATSDEDWGGPVWPAASWEDGRIDCCTVV